MVYTKICQRFKYWGGYHYMRQYYTQAYSKKVMVGGTAN